VYTVKLTATNAAGSDSEVKANYVTTFPTTVTFYSVAADDGWVLESSETSGSGGSRNATANTTSAIRVGDDASKKQYRSILSFNTASLPDACTVATATLSLKRGTCTTQNPWDWASAVCQADIIAGFYNGAQALENADFQAVGTRGSVISGGMSKPASNGAWSTGLLSASGRIGVNKTGYTQMRVFITPTTTTTRRRTTAASIRATTPRPIGRSWMLFTRHRTRRGTTPFRIAGTGMADCSRQPEPEGLSRPSGSSFLCGQS